MPLSNGANRHDPPRETRKILLVEDNPDSAFVLTRLLTACGHSVKLASTGAEALADAAQDTFDLVISDINLPDKDGYGLLADLRQFSSLPAIALTGYAEKSAPCKLRGPAFNVYLVKPAPLEQLLSAIEEVCAAAVTGK